MHDSVIALGSNIGDSLTILEAAVKTLHKIPGITGSMKSSWYQTKAIGPPQPDYLNGCISLRADIEPFKLLEILLQIENQFGRERKQRWGARTLDLDLLLYDDLILHTPTLQIPHPRMTQRAFVLVPLAEIVPHWIEPISGRTIKELLDDVDCSDVCLLTSN
ncbi:2-amino-4-hydroxy-6-hydroxymethyldihydropteridine pyrophosphokinase [Rivularia sp. PCC 7116]|uniref:2-amino-4-hydroxy-6- hydroxymethyldihydropteridine diphosphokinase n=1 Tax=Rivularia sp. PCC 7116 TaxID=373994 RepID=UPI00029EFC5B|nr:2-amino-4-hydroxy-6-hydroxymethyldihydropteridine diphosphokinase [Rivularia sp. PCC 7116]AFY55987.1 2-amino-4-hydroxy-6-hydroxymethyldihydropteridine pyrophosphokinase [Rivularia sp. PCC 7116]